MAPTAEQARQRDTLRHDQLVRLLLEAVRNERNQPRRSGYWPERRRWEERQRRWPLFLHDPVGALVHLFERTPWGAYARDPLLVRHYTRAEVRAAAKTVAVALALEAA